MTNAYVVICDNYQGGVIAMALSELPLSAVAPTMEAVWKNRYYAIAVIPGGFGVALEKATQLNSLL